MMVLMMMNCVWRQKCFCWCQWLFRFPSSTTNVSVYCVYLFIQLHKANTNGINCDETLKIYLQIVHTHTFMNASWTTQLNSIKSRMACRWSVAFSFRSLHTQQIWWETFILCTWIFVHFKFNWHLRWVCVCIFTYTAVQQSGDNFLHFCNSVFFEESWSNLVFFSSFFLFVHFV